MKSYAVSLNKSSGDYELFLVVDLTFKGKASKKEACRLLLGLSTKPIFNKYNELKIKDH